MLLKFCCLSGCAMEKKHSVTHAHRELCVPRITEQHYLTPHDGAICITDHLVLVPSASSQAQPTQISPMPRTLCAPVHTACILDNLNFLSHLSHRSGFLWTVLCKHLQCNPRCHKVNYVKGYSCM